MIADVGRIGGTDTPVPLLTKASQIILVTRPDFPSLAAAASALRWLAAISTAPVAIVLNGTGTYPRPAVARDLPVPVLAVLPHDPRSARRLRDGIGPRRRSPLGRRTAALAADLATTENPTEEGESVDRAA